MLGSNQRPLPCEGSGHLRVTLANAKLGATHISTQTRIDGNAALPLSGSVHPKIVCELSRVGLLSTYSSNVSKSLTTFISEHKSGDKDGLN